MTALSGAGQFTLFTYFAPYYRQVLGASAGAVSLLFLWFGAFGLLGNVLLSRCIDRFGAARCVALHAGADGACRCWPGRWPPACRAMALVLVPWALGCFASNSAQQARLALAAPALAPALMALNTSAMYLGQALGAASGGALMARRRLRRRCTGWAWPGCSAALAAEPVGRRDACAAQRRGREPDRRRRRRRCAGRPSPASCSASSTAWRCRASAACCRWRSASWWSASAG